ncbi:MAG TPA: glycosyltransferase family 2 protein [Acidimicrobiales bacterium]|nr:glycosyltransferase family 2 protein [Acidimicrobiales bacterium]
MTPTAATAANAATSVVIVSYRPEDWLEPCIRSVIDQADEVIVVDNGSTGALASSLAAPIGATVVRSPRNLGFSGGVNLGVSKARGALVALLNDDALAPPDWLRSSGAVLDDASIAAVGPKVVLSQRFHEIVLSDPPLQAPGDARTLGRQIRSVRVNGTDVLDQLVGAGVHKLETDGEDRWRWTNGSDPFYAPVADTMQRVLVDGEMVSGGPARRLVNSAGMYLRDDGYAGDVGVATADDGRFDQAADRFGVSFTAVVFRRSTWDRLGPLASPYFAYYEDADWCWRAQLAGLRIRYEPATRVVHRWSATSGGSSGPGVRVLSESNRTLTIVRNAPRPLALDHVRWRWNDGPGEGVRTRVLRHLPWAVASRARAAQRLWKSDPEAVWSEWSGRDCSWDTSPALRVFE